MSKTKAKANKEVKTVKETKQVSSNTDVAKPVAFEIKLDDSDQHKKGNVPKRLTQQQGVRPSSSSPQAIAEKLMKAEERRLEQQQERLRRIQERENDCKRVTTKVKNVLGRDPDKNTKLPK